MSERIDDDEGLIIDAPYDAAPTLEVIHGGRVTAIVRTGHGTDTTIAAEVCHVG